MNSAQKMPWTLFALAFTEGAAVMAAELLAGMVVAPFFGNTIVSWAIVLAITLGGLASGYYLGGRLSLKYPPARLLKTAMIGGGIFLILLPFWAPVIMKAVLSTPIHVGLTISLLAFLFPPLLAFGSVSPVLIHKITDSTQVTGNVAGSVYGISTVGGIFYTLLLGLWIIPEFGIRSPAIFSGGLVLLITFIVLFNKGRSIGIATSVALILILLQNKYSGTSANNGENSNFKVLHHSEGLLGQVKVVDFGWKPPGHKPIMARSLLVDNTWQTAINRKTGVSLLDYVYFVLPIVKTYPKHSDILVIGLGGGGLTREIQRAGYEVDVVELDPRLAELSEKYFGLQKMNEVIVDDGRHFINTTEKKYDIVILDVFQGEVPPWQLFTLECFQQVRRSLKADGVFLIEFFGDLKSGENSALKAVYKTLKAAGFKTSALEIGDSEKLLMAANSLPSLNGIGIKAKNYLEFEVDDLSQRLVSDSLFTGDEIPLLTDNRPLLEKMVLESSLEWRDYQNNLFRDNLLRAGYPIVQ